MILIEEYIQKPKSERQEHLRLNEPCQERGPFGTMYTSVVCKGLVAFILNTTIPSGHKIHICHACNNSKCSNPNHLYWGTAKENKMDAILVGQQTVWERTIAKHGLEKAKEIRSKASKNSGSQKGVPKSLEHKQNLSLAIKKWHKEKRIQQNRSFG